MCEPPGWCRNQAQSGELVGLEVTIFNPTLDPDGSIAQAIVACLAHALDDREPRRVDSERS